MISDTEMELVVAKIKVDRLRDEVKALPFPGNCQDETPEAEAYTAAEYDLACKRWQRADDEYHALLDKLA